MSPLVTVIAVCFNHGRFVTECLESIRRQSLTDWQLIVVDDCSTDNSVAAIRAWIDSTGTPCEFIAHERNIGLCRTLNEAVTRASGRYICIVATDDLWTHDKLARQVEAFEGASPRTGVVFSDSYTMSEDGSLLPRKLCDYYRGKWEQIPEGDVFEFLLEDCFVPAPTAMMRRSVFDAIGRYDESLDYEDWDMWLRIARSFEFVFIDEPLAYYRIVSTSMQSMILNRRTVAKHRTQFLIFAKHVGSRRLSAEQRRKIRARLAGDAEALFELDHDVARSFLGQAAMLSRDWRSLVFLIYSRLNLGYASAKRTTRRLEKLIDYIQWRIGRMHRRGT